MRNDAMYHMFILGTTYFFSSIVFEGFKRIYKSNNAHRQLKPHRDAELAYKKKMEELEALEEDDDEEDDDDDDEDDE